MTIPAFLRTRTQILFCFNNNKKRERSLATLKAGEQSDALRILLRKDRKSRHRRIKKLRRYERLAATSQLSLWYGNSINIYQN